MREKQHERPTPVLEVFHVKHPEMPLAGVSRETLTRLTQLTELAIKWTRQINLVSASTIGQFHQRHIVDSAQLWRLAPSSAKSWVDLGSGGGFPGLVIAILAIEQNPELKVTLVEADQRKCAFLATAARTLELNPVIQNRRIEAHDSTRYDVVSARALAPLDKLFGYAALYLDKNGICLFPKGARVESELTRAAQIWHSRIEKIPSATSADGMILRITELRPVQQRQR